MNIGEKIKKLRIEKKLKQSELAEKSGLSRVAIGNYERGDRAPNIEILNKIAVALGTSTAELLISERNLTNVLFLFSSISDNRDNIYKIANIDADSFRDHIFKGEELPEDTLIKLIDAIFQNQDYEAKFLRFYRENYDLLRKYNKVLKFCRNKKKIATNKVFEGVGGDYNNGNQNEELKIRIAPKNKMRSALASNKFIQSSLLYNYVLSILVSKYYTNSIEDLINKLNFDNVEQLAAFIVNDSGKYILSTVNTSLESLKENPLDLNFNVNALNSEIEVYNEYFSSDIKAMTYAENKEGE